MVIGLIYYGLFRWAIVRFDLPTPGREPLTQDPQMSAAELGERGPAFTTALGGAANLEAVGACTTRLRLVLKQPDQIDEAALKALGSRGVLRLGGGGVQVILGPIADTVADEIRAAMAAQGQTPPVGADPAEVVVGQKVSTPTSLNDEQVAAWRRALGGSDNIRALDVRAATRLRLAVRHDSELDEQALAQLGCHGVLRVAEGVWHLVVGKDADALAGGLREAGVVPN